jgi:hypothetical protein
MRRGESRNTLIKGRDTQTHIQAKKIQVSIERTGLGKVAALISI